MILPPTEWVAHTEHPDLRSHDEIAIDLETRDPDLKKKGSGAVIGNGEVVGIAVAVANASWYFPIAHATGPNSDRKKTLEWFKDILECPATKIFHNAMYDVCWIKSLGLKINGLIIDTMIACSLLDENRFSYTLNTLSWHHLNKGKNEKALNEAAKSRGLDPKADMWRLPAMEVGAYAEKDAELTYELWQELKKEILHQDLTSIFELEIELFPCLVDMRFLGVRVDVEAAHKLKEELHKEEKELLQKIKKETQVDVQIWAARSIEKVFQKLSLPYTRTEKTNSPSFTKNFLSSHEHPLVKCIAKAREINKAHTTFIDTIIKHQYKGRIHADINPIRSDSGGTVTGRFSYSNPNLQQIPARNKDLGPMIRSLFIPERDHSWGCFDYSQQEPRLVVHYAASSNYISKDESVKEIVAKFKAGSADFHQTVADMAQIERSQAKTINLGLFYGMGKAKLQAELGLNTKKEAEDLFNKYHDSVPFVKDLMQATTRASEDSGYIKTLLGRRCRFDKWEINKYNPGVLNKAMTKVEAEEASMEDQFETEKERQKYKLELGEITEEEIKNKIRPRIKRAYTYKALNKLIQGSAADMTKKAMLDLYNEKIIPHIQIHDELDISVESKEQANKIIDIMQEAVTLKVPNKVDYESGKNWGDIYD